MLFDKNFMNLFTIIILLTKIILTTEETNKKCKQLIYGYFPQQKYDNFAPIWCNVDAYEYAKIPER